MAKIIKNKEEIEIIAEGGRILAEILKAAAGIIKPGISTWELNAFAEEEIRKSGAEPSFKGYGMEGNNLFPAALCTSINDVVVHGLPSKKDILKDGDIVGLDLGLKFKGFYSDAALTVPVGKVSTKAQKLIDVARDALYAAVMETKPGNHIGDIGSAIQHAAERNGMSVVRDLVGHGVGYSIHEEPAVPCFGKKGEGLPLKVGMVLAIEPMICAGDYKLFSEKGKWPVRTADGSLAAHFEHTVAITEKGSRILTRS